MMRTLERLTSLLLACLVAMALLAGCGDTASSRDAGADANEVSDAVLTDVDASDQDAMDGRSFDSAPDVEAGRDVSADPLDAPDPEAAVCPSAADVPIVLLPDVVVPLDVYETCRTVLPMDAGPPCTPRATEPCTCIDGMSGTRTCRDDTLWGSCRCGVADAGMDATLGSDAPIPRIDVPRLIAPQSGSRATSQRPTFRWVLPGGVTRARLEVCTDRPCTRMLMLREVTGTSWRPAERLPPGVAFWRVRGLGADGSVTWTSATWEVGIRHRDLPNDTSYGAIHDFNGDGYDDVVFYIGELNGYTLRIYPGSDSGLQADRFRGLNPPYPPWTTLDRNSWFGDTIAYGDVNGDGLADLVVAARGYAEPARGTREGRVYVYLGARGALLPGCDQALVPPRRDGFTRSYGYDISAGDFNGDGYADTAVLYNDDESLQLHLGGPSGVDYIPADSAAGVGYTARFVGDVNGDGYADLATRVHGNDDSWVVILYGNPAARLLFHVQGPFRPRYLGTSYGFEMQGGDFNSDGYSDVIIAGWGFADALHGSQNGLATMTRVITPRGTSDARLDASPSGAFAGSVSAPGDLDGDGRSDIVIGAVLAPIEPEGRSGGRGLAFVYHTGGGRFPERWSEVLGPSTESRVFGVSAIPGDLNGDGFDDLLIGGPRA